MLRRMRGKIYDCFLPLPSCSQSLLNLLIIGIATPHVFDGDKDLGGIGEEEIVICFVDFGGKALC